MFATKLKAGAVVLLVSCTFASLTTLSAAPPEEPAAEARSDGDVQSKDRLFRPDRTLMYVNLYSTDPNHIAVFLHNYAKVNILPEIERVRGVGSGRILGHGGSAMRIKLNPDHMRAHNVPSNDIEKAVMESTFIGQDKLLDAAVREMFPLKEHELIFTNVSSKPEHYDNLVLRANEKGETLQLKDVGKAESLPTPFDVSFDVDGRPAATIVLKRSPDANSGGAIEAVNEKLKEIEEASFPPGMAFETIPFDSRHMIYAIVETPRGSTLESTSAKCHELAAIARGVDGIASVFSLAGYQIRTEQGGSNVATCLIHLKDRSDRKPIAGKIIETLEEKCRTMHDVHLDFFEPPAVSTFVAIGGFSVRVLKTTNSSNDERSRSAPDTSMIGLLNRKDLAGLFDFLASNYPQYELVIDNDVARQKGVSIASALENLAKVVGKDDSAEQKFRSLTESLSRSSVKNEREEMVPYNSFMQLTDKLRLNEIDR